MRLLLLALAAAAAAGRSASATTFHPVERTCPIGGEKFESFEMVSNSHFGARPDGKPYGPTPIVPLVECRDNGFLFFDEAISESELALLAPIVAGAEYQTMRHTETDHYRAWWLLIHSGRNDPVLVASLLLTASWEADEAPERKARYQGIFAGAAAAIERSPENAGEWFWLNLRGANALRELGRYDAAGERLDMIDQPGVLPPNAEERAGARSLIDGLRALIRERNSVSEPLRLVPLDVAARLCLDDLAAPSEKARCGEPDIRAAMARIER
jgi:hypothetical protein